jgi:hypothetical protein
MSKPEAPPALYTRVVPLDSKVHGSLTFKPTNGFKFASATSSVPVGIVEFGMAAQHYPILFTNNDEPMPVVLLGHKGGVNLHVNADGTWRSNSYVPAYLRAYPFIFIEDRPNEKLYLAIDAANEYLSSEAGEALFDDGKPGVRLSEALKFCTAYRDTMAASRAFCAALKDAGVLEPSQASINFTGGGGARVDGFQVINKAKFDALDDATFLAWRRNGWLDLAYAHFYSIGQWSKLVDLAAASETADRMPAEAPIAGEQPTGQTPPRSVH